MNNQYPPDQVSGHHGQNLDIGAKLSHTMEVQPEREPKAVILLHRIHDMENIIDRLCQLRDTIEQGNVPRQKTGTDAAPTEPTVAHILNEGPEILGGQHNRMMDVIGQIEQLLF